MYDIKDIKVGYLLDPAEDGELKALNAEVVMAGIAKLLFTLLLN